jgi:hypothetical protein
METFFSFHHARYLLNMGHRCHLLQEQSAQIRPLRPEAGGLEFTRNSSFETRPFDYDSNLLLRCSSDSVSAVGAFPRNQLDTNLLPTVALLRRFTLVERVKAKKRLVGQAQ